MNEPKAVPISVQINSPTAPARRRLLTQMIKRVGSNKRSMIGLWIVTLFILIAILAPWISPYNPLEQNMDKLLQSPSLNHPFGTDEYGRDILSRIFYGARISLMVGIVGVIISVFFGVAFGTIAGYFGGKTESLIMRITDIFMAFPGFLLALAIVSVLGPGMMNLMIAIGIFSIPSFTWISRSAVLSIKSKEYIEASRSMGSKHSRIIFKHIIPNSIAPIIVLSTLRIATAILSASGLSFLGMGAQPPSPEWGTMLSTGREFLRTAPHISIVPGVAIMLVVLGFNMLGDGLRDALDPKMKL
ncbi:peptide/nickel transport system permease protein [Paenibacillus amylolyticus]|uniref:Peptide/nickel transport system permease protein n=1 Tax=Paenibacillus amylolyticus TaxID=1451 RepID=A0AAP5LRM1_PAEAM|nr:nickel transporter permease [Paenibacillus amylolyticus]MDR6724579.1 peptide/nickel transport system permease protein [Paenibacillus amylolyticus]